MKGKLQQRPRGWHATRSQVGFKSTTSGLHGCRVGNYQQPTSQTLATCGCDRWFCLDPALAGNQPSVGVWSLLRNIFSCQNQEGSKWILESVNHRRLQIKASIFPGSPRRVLANNTTSKTTWLSESKALNPADRKLLFLPSVQSGGWKDQGRDETKRCGIFLCWFSIHGRLGSEMASSRMRTDLDSILISSLFSCFSSSISGEPVSSTICIPVLLLITRFFPAVFQFSNIKTINQPGDRAKQQPP